MYARLVALTDGQAKNILKEMAEKEGDQIDGFKALVIFCKRFDIKTVTTTLQAFQQVSSPPPIKNVNEVFFRAFTDGSRRPSST